MPVPDHVAALVQRAAEVVPLPPVVGYLAVEDTGRHRRRQMLLAGRGHVANDLVVLDWRSAPLATVFFRHDAGDSYELAVDDRDLDGVVIERALVEVHGGRAVALRTERVPARPPPNEPPASRGALPVLDPVQQRAVELPADRGLVVDGEAGVGKTLVGMYRVAHLARVAAEAGRTWRALVLTPTAGLRRLCRVLADRLGIVGLDIAIVDDWLLERARAAFRGLPERTSRDAGAEVIRLKRHPAVRIALAAIARRRHRHDPEEPLSRARGDLLALWGDRQLLEQIAAASDGALGAREVAAVAAHTHVQFTTTTEDQHRHVDADRLVTVDGLRLDEGTPLGDADSLDVEDAPVLFELARRRGQRFELPRWDHVFVDEAQLIAPMELAAIGDAVAAGGAVTLAGDHRQATDDSTAFAGWDPAVAEVGAGDCERVTLAIGYRSTPAITAFARALVSSPPASLPTPAGDPSIAATAFAGDLDQIAGVIAALDAATRAAPWLQIAVVGRNADHARRLHRELARGLDPVLVLDGEFDFLPGIQVTTIGQVQGLEFDAVVVPDLAPGFYPERAEVQRGLYVAVTRARGWLWLTTAAAWSPLVA